MSAKPETKFLTEIDDYALLSKIKGEPTARLIDSIPYLFFNGSYWNINLLLGDFSSFDTDVYAVLEYKDTDLNLLIKRLTFEGKLSLSVLTHRYLVGENSTTWVAKSEFYNRGDSIQEEFITWLIEDLKFEFYR